MFETLRSNYYRALAFALRTADLKTAVASVTLSFDSGVLNSVAAEIATGSSLHQALSRHRFVFPPDEVELLRVAEENGVLREALLNAAPDSERTIAFRRYWRHILLVALACIIFVTATWQLLGPGGPAQGFRRFYNDMLAGEPLPYLTQWTLTVSTTITDHAGPVLFCAALAFALYCLACILSARVSRRAFSLLPGHGDLRLERDCERFCRWMAISSAAGMTGTEALAAATTHLNVTSLRKTIREWRDKVGQGISFKEAATHTFLSTGPIRLLQEGIATMPGDLAVDDYQALAASFRERSRPDISHTIGLLLLFALVFAMGLAILGLSLLIPLLKPVERLG